MAKLNINDQPFQSHSRDSEPDDLKPWRIADDLIKQGKLDEAAAHIKTNVPKDAPVQHSTLTIRVALALGDRLT